MSQASTCEHPNLPPGARFCPLCGAGVAPPPPLPPRREHHIQIDQRVDVAHGRVTGLEVDTVEGDVTVVQGHIIQIDNPSPEAVERLMATRQLGTEVRVGSDNNNTLGVPAERVGELGAQLEVIHQAIQRLERNGAQIDEVGVGKLRIRRVELLLKQAVLLKAEADQMIFDQIDRKKSRVDQMWAQSTDGRMTLDLADLLQDFDSDARDATLRKACALLEEARVLEPHNAEVLLHLAQLVDQLEEDPRQVDKLLYEVTSLLEPPRNDTDKFHLAQAVFLSATLGDGTLHPDMINKARGLFEQLGRSDWVEQCDLVAGRRAYPPSQSPTWQAPAPPPAGLNPAGAWRVQISDGSLMDADLKANGTLLGQQYHPGFPSPIPFTGLWGFDPNQSLLSLQGTVGGTNPFFLQLFLQARGDGSLLGSDYNGHHYQFTRLG